MRFNDEEDRDSLGRFFVVNKRALQSYAWQLTGNSHDAEDLLGETACKLAASWHRSRKRNLAFARKTMRNAWTDTLRHKGRRIKAAPLEPGMDKADSGQEAARVAEVRARITAVMGSLTDREREVFAMHAHERLSFAEIAKKLYISESTAYKAFKRVEERLMPEAEADG